MSTIPASALAQFLPAGVALPFGGAHLGEFVPPLLASCVYLALYAKRARTLARRGAPVSGWRIASFTTGVALVTIVQIGPFDSLGDQILLVHMAQHIIIGDICSLFIVLGLTGPMLRPLLQVRATRPLRIATHPVPALILWAGNLYAWHVPLLYQLAIRHDLVHALEHATLLWFGTLLWIALLGPLPKPRWFAGWARISYVFGVRVVGTILGNVLIWLQTVFYPVYRASDATRGLNPLSDQNLAGALMMVEQMLLTAGLLAWLFFRWLRQEGESQDLLDLAAARNVDLSVERATRAAGSGSTARLREKLLDSASPASDRDRPEAPVDQPIGTLPGEPER